MFLPNTAPENPKVILLRKRGQPSHFRNFHQAGHYAYAAEPPDDLPLS